jgi:hypothetical protein
LSDTFADLIPPDSGRHLGHGGSFIQQRAIPLPVVFDASAWRSREYES